MAFCIYEWRFGNMAYSLYILAYEMTIIPIITKPCFKSGMQNSHRAKIRVRQHSYTHSENGCSNVVILQFIFRCLIKVPIYLRLSKESNQV